MYFFTLAGCWVLLGVLKRITTYLVRNPIKLSTQTECTLKIAERQIGIYTHSGAYISRFFI